MRFYSLPLFRETTTRIEIYVKICKRKVIELNPLSTSKHSLRYTYVRMIRNYNRDIIVLERELKRRHNKEYNGFLASIHINPKESTTYLVFADWLEERNRVVEARRMRREAVTFRNPKHSIKLRKGYR